MTARVGAGHRNVRLQTFTLRRRLADRADKNVKTVGE
jgi:hypothetical protein